MGKTFSYLFFSLMFAEIVFIAILFWRYGADWGNDGILVLAAQAPQIVATFVLCRASGMFMAKNEDRWRPTLLMGVGAILGISGMFFAWFAGAHLSGSVAIYVGLLQGAILWLAVWNAGKNSAKA